VHDLTPEEEVGLGLFPMCSIFNHSCAPNCSYMNLGARYLAYRTIRPVRAGEELNVNYAEIYASTAERRATLMQSKHFLCKCVQCVSTDDAELSGVKCRTPDCPGVYVVPSSSSSSTTTSDTNGDDEKMRSTEITCNACNDVVAADELAARGGRAEAAFAEAADMYTKGMPAKLTRAALESALKVYAATLHERHHLVLDTLLPLTNVCGACGDFDAKLAHATRALELANKVYPRNFMARRKFLEAKRTALLQIIGQAQNAATDNGGRIAGRAKLRTQLNETEADLVGLCATVCGAAHPLTVLYKRQASLAIV
jgi:hypothetical protein